MIEVIADLSSNESTRWVHSDDLASLSANFVDTKTCDLSIASNCDGHWPSITVDHNLVIVNMVMVRVSNEQYAFS